MSIFVSNLDSEIEFRKTDIGWTRLAVLLHIHCSCVATPQDLPHYKS